MYILHILRPRRNEAQTNHQIKIRHMAFSTKKVPPSNFIILEKVCSQRDSNSRPRDCEPSVKKIRNSIIWKAPQQNAQTKKFARSNTHGSWFFLTRHQKKFWFEKKKKKRFFFSENEGTALLRGVFLADHEKCEKKIFSTGL